MNTSELCITFMNKQHNWAQLLILSFTLCSKVKYQPFLPAHFWARCIMWAYAKTLHRGKHSSGRKHSFMKYFGLGVGNALFP